VTNAVRSSPAPRALREIVLSLVSLSPADRQGWVDQVSALAEIRSQGHCVRLAGLDGVAGAEPTSDFRLAGLLAFEDRCETASRRRRSLPGRWYSRHHRHRRSSVTARAIAREIGLGERRRR
jgi:hypothetical protein